MLKMLLMAVDANSIPSWQVVLMGLGIVFVGLIALIFICKIMGAVLGNTKAKETPAVSAPVAPVKEEALNIPNKGEFIAAVSAAIAESMGTDVSKIRIHSIKKVN